MPVEILYGGWSGFARILCSSSKEQKGPANHDGGGKVVPGAGGCTTMTSGGAAVVGGVVLVVGVGRVPTIVGAGCGTRRALSDPLDESPPHAASSNTMAATAPRAIHARKSAQRNRRWPPTVRNDGSPSLVAPRVTVFGCTPKIRPTSSGPSTSSSPRGASTEPRSMRVRRAGERRFALRARRRSCSRSWRSFARKSRPTWGPDRPRGSQWWCSFGVVGVVGSCHQAPFSEEYGLCG
jgi:hypothetical protein